jgi:hypothetical protein
MSFNDELVSQFLAFTGSSDTDQAASYLEMCRGELETAVGMFLEHQGGTPASGAAASTHGGSPGFGRDGGGGMDDIRAPDATRTMRLMDEVAGPSGMMFGMVHPYSMQMNHHPMMGASAFARDVVNQAAAASARRDVGDEMDHDYGDDDDHDDDDTSEGQVGGVESPPPRPGRAPSGAASRASSLADMFAPPRQLIYKEGGFEGARTMAKDNKRWLLVNLQSDAEFSCHALNRDVWRDELVENLIREGFIFWQDVSLCWPTLMEAMCNRFSFRHSLLWVLFLIPLHMFTGQQMDVSPDGTVYSERYHVHDYPHVGIIDPRTRRLMWKKEGWTQQNPFTAEQFAEMAMDFYSRHSFDRPPQAPRPTSSAVPPREAKRTMNEMSEDEDFQAAMRASLGNAVENVGESIDIDDDDDYEMDDDDEEVIVEPNRDKEKETKPEALEDEVAAQPPAGLSFFDKWVSIELGDEPANGARIQFRMPDGKRQIRKFDPTTKVEMVYAFVAVSVMDLRHTSLVSQRAYPGPAYSPFQECLNTSFPAPQHSIAATDKGKEFILMAGYPPKDLIDDTSNTIESCSLAREVITVRWKQ